MSILDEMVINYTEKGERMKCICGFDSENEETKEKNTFRRQEFIHIQGHFTIVQDPGGYCQSTEVVSLYACPKCNTVQMVELW